MARKNNDSEGVIWFIVIVLFFGFFLIKWAIGAIVFIITGIIKLCSAIVRNKKTKKEIKNVIEVPFEETDLANKRVNEESINEEFKLLDMSQYDNLFEDKIIPRGVLYYIQDKITDIVEKENEYTCIAKGTKDYTVKLTFDGTDNKILKEASCSCPYFYENNANCKHIYAALLEIKCGDGIKVLIEEANNIIEAIRIMLNNAEKYINNHEFESKYHDEFNRLKRDSIIKLNNISNRIKYFKNQQTIVDIVKEENELKSDLQNKVEKILYNKTTKISSTQFNCSDEEEDKGSTICNALAGLAIADAISSYKEERDELSTGDQVKIVSGPLQGYDGTVINAYKDCCVVELYDINYTDTFKYSEVEKI